MPHTHCGTLLALAEALAGGDLDVRLARGGEAGLVQQLCCAALGTAAALTHGHLHRR